MWQLVEQSRGDGGLEGHAQRLVELLAVTDEDTILAFNRAFCARMTEAYCWDLFAVCDIVNGDSSALEFDAFLGWLYAQGRAYFETALADPTRAAERATPGERAALSAMWSVASDAYEQRTGRDDFVDFADTVSAVMEGERLTEEDIDRRFGALKQRFGR